MSVPTNEFNLRQLSARLRCDVGDLACYLNDIGCDVFVHLSHSQLARVEALRRDDEKQIERFEKKQL